MAHRTLQERGFLMIAPMNRIAFAAFLLLSATWPGIVHAQDFPCIEICTVEKTMERRTSCLQSNVDYLQKTITKLNLDHQQKQDAAARQIDALKTSLTGLQKTLGDLQAAQVKSAEDLKKKQDAPPTKDANKDAAKYVCRSRH